MPTLTRSTFGRTVLLAIPALALLVPAAAENTKLSPELRKQAGTGALRLIVQYVAPPSASDKDRIALRGGKVGADLKLVNGIGVTISANQVADLSNDPAVKYVSSDRKLGGQLTNTAPTVNAPYAWSLGFDGSGVGVAILDSGIADKKTVSGKSDLNKWGAADSRIVYSQTWVNDGLGTFDGYGHGTHVASIVAGNGFNSFGSVSGQTYKGVAPNASLINLRVLDTAGVGTDSGVIAALQAAIQLKSKYNIRVINLSLGRPVYESYKLDPLCQAVEAAYRAGIVVVVAAGNEGRNNSAGNAGYATINSPANDPYVITVGAMKSMGTAARADDLIATYSSKGPTAIDHIVKPDLVAPGNNVVAFLGETDSTLAAEYPGNFVTTSNGRSLYFTLSGTSMAAPVVSGATALLVQQNPAITPDQVKARLMKTAYKTFPHYSSYTDPATGVTYTSQYDLFTVGAGYLDIQAALSSRELSTGAAKSPAAQYDPATQSVYFVNDTFAVWDGSTDWSSFAVWGGSAFVGSNFAVWGGSTPWASFAVWGGSAAWGSNTTSGFFAVWGGNTVPSSGTTAEALKTLSRGER